MYGRPMQIQRRYLIALALLPALVLATALLKPWQHVHSRGSSGSLVSAIPFLTTSSMEVLKPADADAYRAIFAAQLHGEWQSADALIGTLTSPVLMGHVLAERYLSASHTTSNDELQDWLKLYHEHPQASALRTMAERRGVTLAHLPSQKQARLRGYGDDNGLAASFADSPHAVTWHKAMKAWREGSRLEAAKLFSSLLKDEDLSPWKRAAAAYWSHRAYHLAGRRELASEMLEIAASEPRSFYGILARQKLGQSLDLDTDPIELSAHDMEDVLDLPQARRAVALVQVGRDDLAERELRLAFPGARHEEKILLLGLAHRLNLPSVQIAMARQLGGDERSFDFARYPIPQWEPKDGFQIDPALLYALIRQESGFHTTAQSPAGAMGLMQLMPDTARYMNQKRDDNLITALHTSDPHVNMALGQDYVRHLLANDLVEGNLIFMLTAYNAGPGRLQEWKKSIDYRDDPLLFIESIPYPETRNYVMQVMTNYWIYSQLTGSPSRSAKALLSGSWPSYQAG